MLEVRIYSDGNDGCYDNLITTSETLEKAIIDLQSHARDLGYGKLSRVDVGSSTFLSVDSFIPTDEDRKAGFSFNTRARIFAQISWNSR